MAFGLAGWRLSVVRRDLAARTPGSLRRRFQRLDLACQILVPEQYPVELLLLAIHDIAQLLYSPLQVGALAFEAFESRVVDHLLR